MDNPTLIIHIGPHKTATTFLQKNIFPQSKNARYLGRYVDERALGEPQYSSFMKWVCNGSTQHKEKLCRFLKGNPINTFLISDEWLSSDYSGNDFKVCPWQEKIERISQLAPCAEIKIVYCVRESALAIASLYREFQQERIIKKGTDLWEFAKSNTGLFYNYKETESILESTFGREKICHFRFNPDGLSEEKLRFCFLEDFQIDNREKINTKHKDSSGHLIQKKHIVMKTLSTVFFRFRPILRKSRCIAMIYHYTNGILSQEVTIKDLGKQQRKALNEYFDWRQ